MLKAMLVFYVLIAAFALFVVFSIKPALEAAVASIMLGWPPTTSRAGNNHGRSRHMGGEAIDWPLTGQDPVQPSPKLARLAASVATCGVRGSKCGSLGHPAGICGTGRRVRKPYGLRMGGKV